MWVIATLGGASRLYRSTLAQICARVRTTPMVAPRLHIRPSSRTAGHGTSVLILTYMGGFNLLFNVADAFTGYSWANWTPWIVSLAVLAGRFHLQRHASPHRRHRLLFPRHSDHLRRRQPRRRRAFTRTSAVF